jgi:hypothetical protein
MEKITGREFVGNTPWSSVVATVAAVGLRAAARALANTQARPALIRLGYSGTLSLKYEKDEKDPLPGAAGSIGYMRGVLAAQQT